jgi:hypothetical protein
MLVESLLDRCSGDARLPPSPLCPTQPPPPPLQANLHNGESAEEVVVFVQVVGSYASVRASVALPSILDVLATLTADEATVQRCVDFLLDVLPVCVEDPGREGALQRAVPVVRR